VTATNDGPRAYPPFGVVAKPSSRRPGPCRAGWSACRRAWLGLQCLVVRGPGNATPGGSGSGAGWGGACRPVPAV